jgi:hypothetical protein
VVAPDRTAGPRLEQLRPTTPECDIFIVEERPCESWSPPASTDFCSSTTSPNIALDRHDTPQSCSTRPKPRDHHQDVGAALSAIANLAADIDRDWKSITNWPTVRSLPTAGVSAVRASHIDLLMADEAIKEIVTALSATAPCYAPTRASPP